MQFQIAVNLPTLYSEGPSGPQVALGEERFNTILH